MDFSAPIENQELRAKWELAVNGRVSGSKFKLCMLHFREEDFLKTGKCGLKEGTVPISIPVPKTEMLV